MFQHTAARRRPTDGIKLFSPSQIVSTHSRPKATDDTAKILIHFIEFQHTAARRRPTIQNALNPQRKYLVSTHSRPKATESQKPKSAKQAEVFQHTAARRRPMPFYRSTGLGDKFQHTAARRRPTAAEQTAQTKATVSTHSRPKATDGHIVTI